MFNYLKGKDSMFQTIISVSVRVHVKDYKMQMRSMPISEREREREMDGDFAFPSNPFFFFTLLILRKLHKEYGPEIVKKF